MLVVRGHQPSSPDLHSRSGHLTKRPFYPTGPKHSHEPVEATKPLYPNGRSSTLLSHDSSKRKCPEITENDSDEDNRHFSRLLAGFF